MRAESAGLFGRLAADRPRLALGILAAALATAMSAVTSAAPEMRVAAGHAGDLALRSGGAVAIPMLLYPLLPRRAVIRVLGFFLIAAAAGVAAWALRGAPDAEDARRTALGLVAVSAWLIAFAPLIGGGVLRKAAVALPVALLAVLAAIGLSAQAGLAGETAVLIAISISGGAAMVAASAAAAECSSVFAMGRAAPLAAGIAARRAFPVAVFTAGACTAAFFAGGLGARGAAAATLVVAGAALAAVFTACAVMAAIPHDEAEATADNMRRRAGRAFWAPLRRMRVRTAVSVLGVAAILGVIAAFERNGLAPPVSLVWFYALLLIVTLGSFFSVRITVAMLVVMIAAEPLASLVAPTQDGGALVAGGFVGRAFAALVIGVFLQVWRREVAPSRSARETLEFAAIEGTGRLVLAAGLAVAGLLYAAAAGAWPGAGVALGRFLAQGAIGAALLPMALLVIGDQLRTRF